VRIKGEKKRGYVKRVVEFLDVQTYFETFGRQHFDSLEQGVKELEEVIQFANKFLKKYYKWKRMLRRNNSRGEKNA